MPMNSEVGISERQAQQTTEAIADKATAQSKDRSPSQSMSRRLKILSYAAGAFAAFQALAGGDFSTTPAHAEQTIQVEKPSIFMKLRGKELQVGTQGDIAKKDRRLEAAGENSSGEMLSADTPINKLPPAMKDWTGWPV